MNMRAAAIFPDAGIRLEGQLGSLEAEPFQQKEQTFVGLTRQAAVAARMMLPNESC